MILRQERKFAIPAYEQASYLSNIVLPPTSKSRRPVAGFKVLILSSHQRHSIKGLYTTHITLPLTIA